MDQIDQIESNGLHSTKPGQMASIQLSVVKWSNGVLLYQHSGFKASESNGSNRSNGVKWTPFD